MSPSKMTLDELKKLKFLEGTLSELMERFRLSITYDSRSWQCFNTDLCEEAYYFHRTPEVYYPTVPCRSVRATAKSPEHAAWLCAAAFVYGDESGETKVCKLKNQHYLQLYVEGEENDRP